MLVALIVAVLVGRQRIRPNPQISRGFSRTLASWPADTLFVVYCAGPHCNGADKAALRLAQLGRRVKVMIGGMTGWADEGFTYALGPERGSASV
jgi:rhodanese-related sulfurtransferase